MSIDPKDSQDLPADDLEISTDDAEAVKGGHLVDGEKFKGEKFKGEKFK